MTSPFDYVKSITKTKEDLYADENSFEKEYVPFIVNRSLSNGRNYLPFAEILDKYSELPKKIQYDFYFLGIPKTSRWQQLWTKKEKEVDPELLEFIATEIGCNIKKAIAIRDMLGVDKINEIRNSRGGKNNDRTRKK